MEPEEDRSKSLHFACFDRLWMILVTVFLHMREAEAHGVVGHQQNAFLWTKGY